MVVVVEHEDVTNVKHCEEDEDETEGSDDNTALLLSTSSSEELSIELPSINPESLSSSSSIKSSCSSSIDSSSESVNALSSWTLGVMLVKVDDSSCSSESSVEETSLVSVSTEVVVSSHSRAGVEAWAWVRAGWCNTSSAQRAWGGDVQITLAGTTSVSSPDHRRLPLARGSPIVECPLFCTTDISAHMML